LTELADASDRIFMFSLKEKMLGPAFYELFSDLDAGRADIKDKRLYIYNLLREMYATVVRPIEEGRVSRLKDVEVVAVLDYYLLQASFVRAVISEATANLERFIEGAEKDITRLHRGVYLFEKVPKAFLKQIQEGFKRGSAAENTLYNKLTSLRKILRYTSPKKTLSLMEELAEPLYKLLSFVEFDTSGRIRKSLLPQDRLFSVLEDLINMHIAAGDYLKSLKYAKIAIDNFGEEALAKMGTFTGNISRFVLIDSSKLLKFVESLLAESRKYRFA
jgi:hypothetical protein